MRYLILTFALLAAAFTARAATVTVSTNASGGLTYTTNAPSFIGGITEAGTAAVNFLKSDTNAVAATNWIAVPYLSYEVQSKHVGYGLAVVHPIGNYALVGARIEHVDGQTTAESINLQLQTQKTYFGITFIPFAISGTGLESGDLAGYAGVGIAVNFHRWDIWDKHYLTLGASGDYEKWVHAISATHINAGINLGIDW